MNLILASASIRRKDILNKFGYPYKAITSNYCEKDIEENPVLTSLNNAKGKANDVFLSLTESQKQNAVVLGCDTVVLYNGNLFEKPKDETDAKNMLKSLSGNTHKVYSGFFIKTIDFEFSDTEETEVVFNELSEQLIDEYVKTGKPMDKAGAYGVQDGFNLVKEYKGSFYNVVGLPIERIKPILDLLLYNSITVCHGTLDGEIELKDETEREYVFSSNVFGNRLRVLLDVPPKSRSYVLSFNAKGTTLNLKDQTLLPILAVCSAFACSTTKIENVDIKRANEVSEFLTALNVANEIKDGALYIFGKAGVEGGVIDCNFDKELSLSAILLATQVYKSVKIKNISKEVLPLFCKLLKFGLKTE